MSKIERDKGVRILLAVESGSRVWGFHNADSDYDVRFIYVRPEDQYLCLSPPRDVIELPIEHDLDISGWDINKALRLILKSNVSVIEWLKSPIIYMDDTTTRPMLDELTALQSTRISGTLHYLAMCHKQYHRYVSGQLEVPVKKYFYCLRPLFAARWLMEHDDGLSPPIGFGELLSLMVLPAKVGAAIYDLIGLRGSETIPHIKALNEFILDELGRHKPSHPKVDSTDHHAIKSRADEIFRQIISSKSSVG